MVAPRAPRERTDAASKVKSECRNNTFHIEHQMGRDAGNAISIHLARVRVTSIRQSCSQRHINPLGKHTRPRVRSFAQFTKRSPITYVNHLDCQYDIKSNQGPLALSLFRTKSHNNSRNQAPQSSHHNMQAQMVAQGRKTKQIRAPNSKKKKHKAVADYLEDNSLTRWWPCQSVHD